MLSRLPRTARLWFFVALIATVFTVVAVTLVHTVFVQYRWANVGEVPFMFFQLWALYKMRISISDQTISSRASSENQA